MCRRVDSKRRAIRNASPGVPVGRYSDVRLIKSTVVSGAPGKAAPVPHTPSGVRTTMGSVFTTNRWVGQSADNSLTGPGGHIHERLWIGLVISPPRADAGALFPILSTPPTHSNTPPPPPPP